MGISYHPAGAGGGSVATSHDAEILCDDNGPFIRRFSDDGAGGATTSDFLLDGTTVYVTVGTVRNCANNAYVPHCDRLGRTPQVYLNIEDAEEDVNGVVDVNDNDLEIGHASGEDDSIIGMRFTATIPQGARITRATIQFRADQNWSGDAFFRIFGEGSDVSPGFIATPFDLSNRPYTRCQVVWTPEEWFDGDAGPAQETTDISSIIQEIVSRPGWVSGSTMGIHIRGERGKRQADAFVDGLGSQPTLIVEYEEQITYYTVFGDDNTVIGDFYTDPADGVWKSYTPTGTPHNGECPDHGCKECDPFIPTPPDEDINIDFDDAEPDLVRLTGGATHSKAVTGVQGVTVNIVAANGANPVNITTKSGLTAVDYAPITFTWNAPDDLENTLSITAVGTAIAYVHWTEV